MTARARSCSYEEYHPYGTSAYRAVKSNIEAPPKRYRYTGMERDEESGLSYHHARYYATWLARWVGPDPNSIRSGINLYSYCNDCPCGYSDRQGRQPDPWLDPTLQSIIQDVHAARSDLMSMAAPNVPAGPLTPYDVARRQAGTGQRAFRVANNLVGTGGTVQAGHVMQVETSVATLLPRAVRDNPATMMALHSRIDPLFQVQSTFNAGTPAASVAGTAEVSATIPWESTNTRHTAQEALIVDAASRPMEGPVTQAQARGAQVSGGEEGPWRTENTPWDQRNANAVTASKASTEAERIEASAAVKAYRNAKSATGLLPKVKVVGGAGLGMVADVADAASSKNPLYVTLKVTTAATQGTGGMVYVSGLLASSPQAMAFGTTIAGTGAAASLAVSTVALAVHDTQATLEGKPTAAYMLGKSMADYVVEGEAQGGFVGGLKQGVGWTVGVAATSFAVLQGEGLWAPFNYQR